MTLDDDLPPILTVDQAAQILGISRGLAFAAARTGDIPTIRIGRRILVPRDPLRRLLDTPTGQESAWGEAPPVHVQATPNGHQGRLPGPGRSARPSRVNRDH